MNNEISPELKRVSDPDITERSEEEFAKNKPFDLIDGEPDQL